MEGRQEIQITEETKGILVYAKAIKELYDDWLLLIDCVGEDLFIHNVNLLMIYTHVGYCLRSKRVTLPDARRWGWYDGNYKFYTVTEEERNKIKGIIKENNLKYIKALNKVVVR